MLVFSKFISYGWPCVTNKFLQVKAWVNDGKDVRLGDWKAAEVEIMNTLQLLSAKPVVYLVSCLFMIG